MQNAWWTYWGFVSWHIKTYSLTSLSWNIVFLILHIITNSFLCEKVCNVLQSLFRLQFMLSNWNLKDIRRNKCNILFSFTDIYKQISELKVLCLSFSHTLRVWNCIIPITRGKDHRERCFYTHTLLHTHSHSFCLFFLSSSLFPSPSLSNSSCFIFGNNLNLHVLSLKNCMSVRERALVILLTIINKLNII